MSEFANEGLFWLSIILVPIVMACLFAVRSWRPILIMLAPWAALPALAAALFCGAFSGGQIPWVFLGAGFGLDITAKVFLATASWIWLIAGLYAVQQPERPGRARFFCFYLLAMAGNLGLILAADVISFYVLFALMSFASWVLVMGSGKALAKEAGTVYVCFVVLGEVLIFLSLVMAVYTSGSFWLADLPAGIAVSSSRNLIIGAAWIGFGIKIGLLPLHVWMPLAYRAAPLPASAVLSGAMVNAGLLGYIRFFPLGETAFPVWGTVMMAMGLVGAFYGVVIGVTQRHVKTVLAYSSISQMGTMTVLLGAGLYAPQLWPYAWVALLVYATHHALAKSALFLSVDINLVKQKRFGLQVLVWAGVMFPALAISGAPLSSGYIAKYVMKYGLKSLVFPGELTFILGLAAAGTTLLMARFLWLKLGDDGDNGHQVWVSGGATVAWLLLVLTVGLMPVLLVGQDWVELPWQGHLLDMTWSGVWPFVMGVMIVFVAWIGRWKNSLHIPEGDILVIYRRVWGFSRQVLTTINKLSGESYHSLCGFWNRVFNISNILDNVIMRHGVRWMEKEHVFGTVIMMVWMVFFLVLVWHSV